MPKKIKPKQRFEIGDTVVASVYDEVPRVIVNISWNGFTWMYKLKGFVGAIGEGWLRFIPDTKPEGGPAEGAAMFYPKTK